MALTLLQAPKNVCKKMVANIVEGLVCPKPTVEGMDA
jgi:hypothetical protein